MARDVVIAVKGSRWTSSDEDLIEFAWLIIAGAMNVGDPPVDPVPGWHDAARQWRDLYHEYLDRTHHPVGEHLCKCPNGSCPGCI